METKEFATVHLNNLKIDDLFSLNKSTIEFADRVKENIGELPNAILVRLATDHHAMEVQMNKALKNELTPLLTEMNADREDRYSEVKRTVTYALKGRDAVKRAAAESLKIFLDPYWDIYKKSMNTRTGIFSEMLGKYNESATLKAHAVTIGISQMMIELAGSNSDFNEGYQARLMQEAAAEGPSASSYKAAVIYSYGQFCTSIEQVVNFIPSDVFNTLFNQLDELRKTYARLVRTEEEEPEEIPAPVQ